MKTRRGLLVIAGSALVHAVLLAVLLRAPVATPRSPDLGLMTVSLSTGRDLSATAKPPSPAHAVASLPKPAKPKPPAEATDVTPQFVDASPTPSDLGARDPLTDPVALSVAAAASGASGEACNLAAWLQNALQNDAQVQTALQAIPRPARSVSNALMLWDGAWVDADPRAAAGVGAIRAAVLSGVRSAPQACLSQLVRGPELMTLTRGSDTTVIALGSGEWRWGDLLQFQPAPRLVAASLAVP